MAVTSMFLPKVAMVHMQPSSMVIGRMNRTFPGSLYARYSRMLLHGASASKKSEMSR